MFKQNVPRFLFRALIPPGLHCRELKTADVELGGLNKIAAKPKAAKFVKQKFGSRVENAILVEQSIIANRDPRTQSIVNSATINARSTADFERKQLFEIEEAAQRGRKANFLGSKHDLEFGL